jgi:hypothetical protein
MYWNENNKQEKRNILPMILNPKHNISHQFFKLRKLK